MTELSIGIIGSGPGGINSMAAFNDLKKKGQPSTARIVCYEKQPCHGGMWNITWKTGIDSSGENIPNSMYNNLWTNNAKECVEMPTYTFDDHFKMPLPSYLPSSVMYDYLTGYFNFVGGKN